MEGNNSGLCGASSAAEDCGAKNEGPLSSSCGDGGSGAANATVDTPNIVGSDARESDAPQGRRRDAEDRGPITVKFAVSRPSQPESARGAWAVALCTQLSSYEVDHVHTFQPPFLVSLTYSRFTAIGWWLMG
eukprot:GHVU01021652.1.p2 GENE.GHVU01021652.1~~GHVU01021652.1.p2  ORF type:complete len:132 (+),score=2.27 GHVU01021652.1:92-487(+)